MPKLSIATAAGQQEVDLGIELYKEAANEKLSFSQLVEQKFPQAPNSKLSTFEQMVMSASIRLRSDTKRGINASTIDDIYYANGPMTRPDGADRNTPAGRVLFPEILQQLVWSGLQEDRSEELDPWENAFAMTTSVTSPRVDQVQLNISGAQSSRSVGISQLTRPGLMMSFTVGSRSYTIPTVSIGVMFSDEAMRATTIDRLGITLREQAKAERIARIHEEMLAIIAGDTDAGINATTFVNASTFDAAVNATDKITHKAFVKWLNNDYYKKRITHVLTDIDAMLEVQNRTGKPTATLYDLSSDPNNSPVDFNVARRWQNPQQLLLPTSIVGANQLVGFDSSVALERFINLSAQYSAIEQMVMLKGTEMRFDFGMGIRKMYDEAFTGLTLGA